MKHTQLLATLGLPLLFLAGCASGTKVEPKTFHVTLETDGVVQESTIAFGEYDVDAMDAPPNGTCTVDDVSGCGGQQAAKGAVSGDAPITEATELAFDQGDPTFTVYVRRSAADDAAWVQMNHGETYDLGLYPNALCTFYASDIGKPVKCLETSTNMVMTLTAE